jgi:hypothetical protein
MTATRKWRTYYCGVISYLRTRRTRLAVSTLGVLLTTLAVPKVLPVWLASYAGTTTGSYPVLSMKADEKVLSGLVFAGGYLREAIETVENEQEDLRAEQEAFGEFAREVQSMPTQPTRPSTPGAMPTEVATASEQLGTVRARYRETVMATADFEAAYDETLEEHMSAEFGPDLAAVVSGDGQLTAPVKRLLVQQTEGAISQRERLLAEIETERASLAEIEPEIDAADDALGRTNVRKLRQEPFDALIEREHELRRLRQTCERLLASRQQAIQHNRRRTDGEGLFLQEYLYQAMDKTFPALTAIADRLERLDERRQAVTRAIARRD